MIKLNPVYVGILVKLAVSENQIRTARRHSQPRKKHRRPSMKPIYYNPRSRHSVLQAALVVLSLSGAMALAQTNVSILSTEIDSSEIRFLVDHPVAGSTNFVLESSSTFTNWTSMVGATVSVVDSGAVQLSIPKPAARPRPT